jgi:hypothetical protein
MVSSYVRKRKNGSSYSNVRQHVRGSGVAKKKSLRGTPAYLSERPSPSEVLRAGYGVNSRVQLIAPQTGWNDQPMDPKFAHPIGSLGTIKGHFGSDPIVKWDSDAYEGGQVVDPKKLRVIGKTSGKKEVLATASYEKIKNEAGGIGGYYFWEDRGKVGISRTKPVFNEYGMEVGDVTYELIGRKHGDHIDFDTPKLDLSRVPRPQRYMVREAWEQEPPDIEFPEVSE